MKDECFYEEISSIVARVSTRTLKMKTNNVKLLNKIGFELSHILTKVNDIVRLYQTDKNDFINDVELIQRDYIDISRKIDQKFTQEINNSLKGSNSNSLTLKAVKDTSNSIQSQNQTNLQRILDTSNSSIDNDIIDSNNELSVSQQVQKNKTKKTKKKKKKNKLSKSNSSSSYSLQMDTSTCSQNNNSTSELQTYGLMIPDTCPNVFESYLPAKVNYVDSTEASKFIVRETIDTNECLNADMGMISHLNDNVENMENTETLSQGEEHQENDITQIQRSSRTSNIGIKNARRSISLLDDKGHASTPLAVRKELQDHGLLDLTNSPTPKINKQKSKEVINDLKKQNKSKSQAKSPAKRVKSDLQNKVNSNIDLNSSKKLDKNTTTPVKFLQLDRTPHKSPSLIFRAANDIIQPPKLNVSSFCVPNTKKMVTPSVDKKFDNQFIVAPSIDKKFDNQFDLHNEIPSPKKPLTGAKTNTKKRLKQLTMSQAFAVQKTPTTSKDSPLKNGTAKGPDLDETCLQAPIFNQKGIKNEPMDLDISVDQSGNFKSPPHKKVHVNNSNSSFLKQIKPEPMEETCWEGQESQNSKYMNDEVKNPGMNEFFADFDKVPKKNDGPGFKHVQVVRKQDERKKLGTSTCKECENYWNSLPEDKRPERMMDMCRHRSKYQAPDTPEHYWSISFPNTQDCIDRGYGGVLLDNNDSPAVRRPRRKRPLKLESKSKRSSDHENSDHDFGDED